MGSPGFSGPPGPPCWADLLVGSSSRSSLFNAAAALGEALGPTLGTWLLAQGFRRGTQLLTLLLVCYALATHCSDGTGVPGARHVGRREMAPSSVG